MGKLVKLFSVLSVVLFVAACAQQPGPKIVYYQAPEPSAQTATIEGTTQDPGALEKDQYVAVTYVDGLQVPGRGSIKAAIGPVTVTSGRHAIRLSFWQGSNYGGTTIPMDFKAGSAYVARFQYSSAIWQSNVRVSYWVEDLKTGEMVTEKFESRVTAGSTTTVVPIFVK